MEVPLRNQALRDPRAIVTAGIRVYEQEYRYRPGPNSLREMDACDLLIGDVDVPAGAKQEQFLFERLNQIARYHYGIARSLGEAGYPETVWRRLLDELTHARTDVLIERYRSGANLNEENELRALTIDRERRLVRVLAQHRTTVDPSLPAPGPVRDLCGGDYVGFVRLDTEPMGGSVRIIREFYFKLCETMRIGPYSEACDRWSAVSRDQQVPVGVYRYAVRWPDGLSECDRIELSAGPDNEGRVVRISRSGRRC
jgi:hypothetical protein